MTRIDQFWSNLQSALVVLAFNGYELNVPVLVFYYRFFFLRQVSPSFGSASPLALAVEALALGVWEACLLRRTTP